MSFPPSDMVAAFSRYLYFQRLEQMLVDRHPELQHRVHLSSTEPMYLKVELTSKKAVMLALMNLKPSTVWAVIDPVLHTAPSVWPLNTPNEILVDALHAHAVAYLAGVPVPSPWRWNESEPSAITELADRLDQQGVRVRQVVAHNPYRARGPFHDPHLTIADRAGAYANVSLSGAEVQVSLKPHLGWIVDWYDPTWGVWSRVDIGWSLGQGVSPIPGTHPRDLPVSAVADLISAGPEAWAAHEVWDTPGLPSSRQVSQEALFTLDAPTDSQPPGRTSTLEIVESVLGQLTTYGFGDLEEGDGDAPIRSDHFHIEWRDRAKDVSTSEMQRLNGVAAAAGENVAKRLILITNGGVSRPAAAFADRARAFVFRLDRGTGRLEARNTRAQEALLPRQPPVLEPWFP
ncbi:hypothetical protein ABZ442_02010 [Streptomyces triculaminicus]|uniref:hypothetical protein n=1 Tax=Streptomyces triculaminicus TaxID=2816232 RepID=UPI0033EF1415